MKNLYIGAMICIKGECDMYINPTNRFETMIFNCLDDMIYHDNPVRILDKLIETVIAQNPGKYAYKKSNNIGRPAYSPATLIKSILYAYLNGISSVRRLEQETYINLELIWLTGNLHPDYNTIALFKKNYSSMLLQFCSDMKKVIQNSFDDIKFSVVKSGKIYTSLHEKIFTANKIWSQISKFEDSMQKVNRKVKLKEKGPQLTIV